MSAISLRMPQSLHRRVRSVAKHDRVSINQFITLAVSEKISALETSDYISQRAKRASRPKFQRVLSKVRSREPAAHDRMP